MNNDEEFKEFMDHENNDNVSEWSVIISAINYKLIHMFNFLKKSLDTYKDLANEDPLKKILESYIINLIEGSKHSFKQFDYTFLSDDEDFEDIQ